VEIKEELKALGWSPELIDAVEKVAAQVRAGAVETGTDVVSLDLIRTRDATEVRVSTDPTTGNTIVLGRP
jgi:hypothetical protein